MYALHILCMHAFVLLFHLSRAKVQIASILGIEEKKDDDEFGQ